LNSNSGGDTFEILSTTFKLPRKTRKALLELDAELEKNIVLKQQIQLALSLLGGKNLKEIVRVTMRAKERPIHGQRNTGEICGPKSDEGQACLQTSQEPFWIRNW
jgi:hypothetical protein